MHKASHRVRSAPLHAASSASIVCMDWLVFALNLLNEVREALAISLSGFALCAALVLWIERSRDPEARKFAAQKALVAGVAVALPLPIVGSILGGVALVWALIASDARARA